MPIPDDSGAPRQPDNLVERWLEKFLFASRWILAPFYVALVFCLVLLLIKVVQELIHFAPMVFTAKDSEAILAVLTVIDLTFTGSLLVIVIFSGYENFVSRIEEGDSKDWPEWMAKIDFSGLKLKLFSSIVAISGIQLLKVFMDVKTASDRELTWSVIIHVVFVISGICLALTDRLSGEAKH